MRRKRGKRFAWMPTLGTQLSSGEIGERQLINGRQFSVDLIPGPSATTFPGSQGNIATVVFPVIPDFPVDTEQIQPDSPGALALTMGTEWFCERIVGSLFLGIKIPDLGQNIAVAAMVTAGFFVARANDADSGGGINTPIGSASVTELTSNYSPQHLDAIREPWMWRRSWCLSSQGINAANILTSGFVLAPTTNFSGPASIREGSHIDIKSVRRIGQDDRLFFACSVHSPGPDPSEAQVFTGAVQGYLDVRVLGNTRKAKNDGKF